MLRVEASHYMSDSTQLIVWQLLDHIGGFVKMIPDSRAQGPVLNINDDIINKQRQRQNGPRLLLL